MVSSTSNQNHTPCLPTTQQQKKKSPLNKTQAHLVNNPATSQPAASGNYFPTINSAMQLTKQVVAISGGGRSMMKAAATRGIKALITNANVVGAGLNALGKGFEMGSVITKVFEEKQRGKNIIAQGQQDRQNMRVAAEVRRKNATLAYEHNREMATIQHQHGMEISEHHFNSTRTLQREQAQHERQNNAAAHQHKTKEQPPTTKRIWEEETSSDEEDDETGGEPTPTPQGRGAIDHWAPPSAEACPTRLAPDSALPPCGA